MRPHSASSLDKSPRQAYNLVLRIATLLEQYVHAQIELGHLQPVNVALPAHAVQGMFLGRLVFRIPGDEPVQTGWDEIPEVMATLVLDGLKPGEA